ncbi:MAG: hypothetical protein Q8N77_00890 [Nanoarchaeota archaeon]|nr:hypothetical protein [Nanoarchaeota archaeon]
MKLNTISKGIFTCILAGTLALGISACSKPEEPKQETKEYVTKPGQAHREYVVNEDINKKYSDISLDLTPELKTGQTLHVFASTWDKSDYRNDYLNVRMIKLYENGKLIKEEKGKDNNCLEAILIDVKHEEPGVHSYFAEFTYENGSVRRSETKQAEFTGKILDLPPTVGPLSGGIWVNDNKNELVIDARDDGDNRGIVSAKVYENGKLWKNFDYPKGQLIFKKTPPTWCFEVIPLDTNKKGRYTYWAEFTDQGGNTVETEAIVIQYK